MYNVISSIKNLLRSKFINLTVIASLSLGMLFPMIVLCIGNVMINESTAGVGLYPERTAGIFSGYKTIDMEKALSDHPQIEFIVEASDACNDYIVSGNKMIKTQIAGYSSGPDKIVNFKMIDGRYFTEAELSGNDRLCIISTALQKELGCGVGDIVTVGKEDFTVIGVHIKRELSVNIPIRTFSERYETFHNYNILFTKECDVKTKGLRIINEILDEYGLKSTSYMFLSDFYDEHNDLKNAYLGLFLMFAIASVVLVYAALNISNIMVNKINADMKNYTIRMQLGAAKGSIFGFLWVQLLILMLISVGADTLIIFLLKKFVPFFAMYQFDLSPTAVLLTVLIGAIYVFILSSSLVKKIFRERQVRA